MPDSYKNSSLNPEIPTTRSNNELIRAYLTDIKVLTLRIETLIAMNDDNGS